MIGWFLSTKIGQYLAFAGAALAAVGVVILKAVRHGEAKAEAKQTKQTLENIHKKVSVEEEVSRLSDDAARRRLREWSRG